MFRVGFTLAISTAGTSAKLKKLHENGWAYPGSRVERLSGYMRGTKYE